MVFPLFKLATLAMKQASKPMANSLKAFAVRSKFFRTWVLVPLGQTHHRLLTRMNMRRLGLGKPVQVDKISEQAAVELGADGLGEVIIFGLAAGLLYIDYKYSAIKSANKEELQQIRMKEIENQIKQLHLRVELQSAMIEDFRGQRKSGLLNRFLGRSASEPASSSESDPRSGSADRDHPPSSSNTDAPIDSTAPSTSLPISDAVKVVAGTGKKTPASSPSSSSSSSSQGAGFITASSSASSLESRTVNNSIGIGSSSSATAKESPT